MNIIVFTEALKIVVLAAIFFVWVVRYPNIVEEFQQYQLPNWLRDFVGILKLAFAVMLQSHQVGVLKLGAAGIAILMVAALFIHLKVKNPPKKMLPALSLFVICAWLFVVASAKTGV